MQPYTTKDGRPITFKELPFNENVDERGWVVHKIEAYVGGELAGYIKLSYIPREKWDNIYHGNLWKFRKIAKGHRDVSDDLIEKNDDRAIAEDHKKDYPWSDGEYFVKHEKENAERQYRMYELYFVDKPIVDFIRTEDNFLRQHVALALHEYANQWLKDNFGLKVWMSYCRTNTGQCFYNADLLKLKKFKYREKMTGGFRQEREYMAGKYMNWYKKAQTIYRGDPIQLDISKFDPEYGRKKLTKDLGATMSEGPGIYFTDQLKNAQFYGEHVTQKSISPNAKILSANHPKFTSQQINKIVKSIDPQLFQQAALNWDENFNRGRQLLLNSIMMEENPVNQLMAIWAEIFSHQNPQEFMRVMTGNNIDGIVVDKQENIKHYIIYNPKVLI